MAEDLKPEGLPAGATIVPPMCNDHRVEFVQRLKLAPSDPWAAAEIVGGILLFQQTLTEPDTPPPSGVNALGCMACWSRKNFERTLRILGKGLTHAARVSRGLTFDEDHVFTQEHVAELRAKEQAKSGVRSDPT